MRQAVVLVGGKGTRLGALTRETPKPLLPIDGDVRFLDYVLENLARYGLEEILLSAGHLGEQVEARYAGRSFGSTRLTVIREPEPAGTGGALRFLADRLDDRFLMLNGDSFFDFNYLALAQDMDPDAMGVLALRRVADSGRYGGVDMDGSRIVAFREKDPDRGEGLISGGVYVLKREVLSFIEQTPCSLETDVFPVLAGQGQLYGREFDGYFLDIGIPDSLAQGRREMPDATRRPAVFFDRDGTLNHDAGYTHKPEDLAWTPGAIDAVRSVNDAGWLAVVVTNQAGVARGYYDEAAIDRFHRTMQQELARHGAHIDAFYHCPHHPEAVVDAYRHADHPDRKPNPGMVLRALAELPIERERSVIIGDRDIDLDAGARAGIEGRLYEGGDLGALVRAVLAEARTAPEPA